MQGGAVDDVGRQWCESHWGLVVATFDGNDPVNGFLVHFWLFQRVMDEHIKIAPSSEVVTPWRLNQVLDARSPLCCDAGDDVFARLLGDAVVPVRYRHLSRDVAWQKHMYAVTRGFD